MRATGFTHISVGARDLEESARFYTELFGMAELPAPDFPFPVRWLRAGDLQLHLFQSEGPAPGSQHFGLDVDDFGAAYRRAKELGTIEGSGYFSNVYELPDGAVQFYVRDPSGNLVEINWPDVTILDRPAFDEIKKVEARTEKASKATLYLRQGG